MTSLRLLLSCGLALPDIPQQVPTDSTSRPAPQPGASVVTSQPTTQRARAAFQPGIVIDWSVPAVLVASQVVLRDGPLEFAACFSGKEHESILRIEADANHVFMALGLIGLTHGHPPRWSDPEQRYEPPTGDLVDVRVVANQSPGNADPSKAIELFNWIQDAESKQSPAPRPWIFSGSRRLPDRPAIVSSISGEGIAVVDTPGSLLSLSRSHTSEDIALWCIANTAHIPPEKTPVTIVLTAARPRAYAIKLAASGDWLVNGRKTTLPDVADLITLSQRLTPSQPQPVILEPAVSTELRSKATADLSRLTPARSWEFLQPVPNSAPAASNR